MGARAELPGIRILNVTKHGKDIGFSSFGDKLASLPPNGFVAIDTEFSGLVSDPDVSHEDLQVRYAAIRRIADTRAIFSVGISLFSPVLSVEENPDPDVVADTAKYEVATYDWLMLCTDNFSTNANAGQFLVMHNFDFNRMFKRGIPYVRASTEVEPGVKGAQNEKATTSWRWGKLPRGLLWRIGRQGVPLVVHNGLFDLAFLFAAFQGPLPPTLQGFIGALLECIPAGYWDSKMLAAAASERASFLEYLFAAAVLKESVSVRNSTSLPEDTLTDPLDELPGVFGSDVLCALYSLRGFCPRGTTCPFQHDPFLVVEEEKQGKLPKDSKEAYKKHKVQSKNLKKKRANLKSDLSMLSKKQRKKVLAEYRSIGIESSAGTAGTRIGETAAATDPKMIEQSRDEIRQPATNTPAVGNEGKSHTAGWDAFCTGYVFAAYRASMTQKKLNETRNKIAVSQKLSGLFLCKSSFGDLDEMPANDV